MKLPPCSSQLRSHSRTGHDSASGSGVIGVKELIRNSLTRGPETAFWETARSRHAGSSSCTRMGLHESLAPPPRDGRRTLSVLWTLVVTLLLPSSRCHKINEENIGVFAQPIKHDLLAVGSNIEGLHDGGVIQPGQTP
jgi:hypothetical protein